MCVQCAGERGWMRGRVERRFYAYYSSEVGRARTVMRGRRARGCAAEAVGGVGGDVGVVVAMHIKKRDRVTRRAVVSPDARACDLSAHSGGLERSADGSTGARHWVSAMREAHEPIQMFEHQ